MKSERIVAGGNGTAVSVIISVGVRYVAVLRERV